MCYGQKNANDGNTTCISFIKHFWVRGMLGGHAFPEVLNWHFKYVDTESSPDLKELLELLCTWLPKCRKTGQLAEGNSRANRKQGWSRLSPLSLVGRELAILTSIPIRAFVGRDHVGALVSHDNWLYLFLRNPIWRTAALKQTPSFGSLTKITILGSWFVNPHKGVGTIIDTGPLKPR